MVFKTRSGQRFYVLLHGSLQNDAPANYVKVVGVKGARRNVTIIFEDAQLGFANYSVPAAPRLEQHFLIRGNGRGQRIIVPDGEYQCNTVPLPPTAIEVTYLASAVRMEDGLATLPNQPNLPNQPVQPAPTQPVVPDVHIEITDNTPAANYPPAEQPAPVYVPGYTGPTGCPIPMTNADFNVARNSVATKDFESTKLTIAKQIVSANCVTAGQVRAMLGEFDFENTRLTFAKYAYHYTYDIGNYYKVNDAFDFESSIKDLSRYVSTH